MPRKGENIYKRKDGRWEGRYIKCRDAYNKARYGYLYGKSYSEVRQRLIQIKAHGDDGKTVNESLENLAELWLDNKKLSVKESTLVRYRTIINKHILPLLEGYCLSDITSDLIQQHMNRLIYSGYSGKTACDILAVIKSILKFASCKGYKTNCDLGIINLKNHKPEIEILTHFEQKKLCNYLSQNPCNKNFGILLCLYTGIRIGELCALKWSDIDIRERVIKIDKTMQRISDSTPVQKKNKTKITVTSPKSEGSVRIIPLPGIIIDLVKRENRNPNAYVLTGRCDIYTEPRNMQYYFKSVLKKCGIRNVKFHTLRHTFATRCVESGFEIKSLSEILGHSSIKITLDRYVHSSMELKRENMNKLDFLSA